MRRENEIKIENKKKSLKQNNCKQNHLRPALSRRQKGEIIEET